MRDAVRAAGRRLTVPRQVILDAIHRLHAHFTVDDVYEAIRARYPQLNVSTIYRNLEALAAIGLITQMTPASGPRTFARREHGPHLHLFCRRCGAVAEMDDEAFESVRAYARERLGFHLDLEHHAVSGLCAACFDQPDDETDSPLA